jgi:hypothetical protein
VSLSPRLLASKKAALYPSRFQQFANARHFLKQAL